MRRHHFLSYGIAQRCSARRRGPRNGGRPAIALGLQDEGDWSERGRGQRRSYSAPALAFLVYTLYLRKAAGGGLRHSLVSNALSFALHNVTLFGGFESVALAIGFNDVHPVRQAV